MAVAKKKKKIQVKARPIWVYRNKGDRGIVNVSSGVRKPKVGEEANCQYDLTTRSYTYSPGYLAPERSVYICYPDWVRATGVTVLPGDCLRIQLSAKRVKP